MSDECAVDVWECENDFSSEIRGERVCMICVEFACRVGGCVFYISLERMHVCS